MVAGLNSVLVFGGAELTSSGGALFEHLLLGCVGIANLDDVLFTPSLVDGSVVVVPDDFLADLAGLKASEANATTNAASVAQDAAGAHLVRRKDRREFMLVHVLGQVGDVKVGVAFVGKLLQLCIEGLSSKADLVTQVMEATDTVLGILIVVEPNESESD